MSSHRRKAYSVPAPEGWCPEVGDYVYLPCQPGQIGSMIGMAKVLRLAAPDWVLVEASYGTRRIKGQYQVRDLRPDKQQAARPSDPESGKGMRD